MATKGGGYVVVYITSTFLAMEKTNRCQLRSGTLEQHIPELASIAGLSFSVFCHATITST